MKILLLRLRLIGDVVFTTPLIRALRRRYPDAHLSYLVESAAAPVVRANPHLDEVIVVPRPRGFARLRADIALAAQLRRARYDVALDLHGGPRSAWLAWASGAPTRIGYTGAGRTWMYSHPVPRPPDLAPRHAVANQWDLLAPLGITVQADPSRDPVEMSVDAAASSRVSARLAAVGVAAVHRLVVIHVSAGNPFRRWPADAFVTLVVMLVRRNAQCRILLTSGPSDILAAEEIAAAARHQLGPTGTAVLDAGEFDLAELRAVVDRAAVYIGGDSGPMHIAATTRTPIVELLGPTLAQRSGPWRPPSAFTAIVEPGPLPCRPCSQRTCAPGDFRCLTTITPTAVAEAAEQALATTGLPSGSSEPVHA